MPNQAIDKKRILTRIRKIKGQVDALEKALESGQECQLLLQQIASFRGAANGLMNDILQTHLRDELRELLPPGDPQLSKVDELAGLINSYLK
ncbi:metal-sensing transcriptional repressor [Pragia fontium]|uniref:DNA-binding transcriptional regulator, FrmR family n=2 Tax=Pragia fontium TaxID=82985 RepID=A0AAJ4WAM0_9GAMM|nr:metal-sensing transcriptional repressor [Pragia fontium]AKJ42336.1 regulator [Pragia fontium]SFC81637.1 DNA-binding transcriptional regulator, FrmR family [Pragia fontium DSM 5563 = ATCC 49100]SUB82628.1 Transcriptional repressor frmR [Pragia fontium]VEJ55529.1 Transcriptional repressor frmR [Pragia fontium]GKX61569.1 hypothetical protein SOASR032_01380 [Pragia fontium]